MNATFDRPPYDDMERTGDSADMPFEDTYAAPPRFEMQPDVPDRAALRAQAAAAVGYTPELAHVELTAADDLAIECGDRVSWFPPGAWEARMATVQACRDDGQYLVHFAFGVTRWVWEQDISLVLCSEAVEVGGMG